MDFIFKRRSVRDFEDIEISIPQVEHLIKAGMQAPSACNSQPWEFLIVENEKDKKAISEMSPYGKPAANANKVIVTMANLDLLKKTKSVDWLCHDMSACTENILLQATVEGIGAVWLGFYPDNERVEKLRNYFDIPKNIIPFSVIPIGFPKQEMPVRENFKPEKIHIGKY